MNKSKFITVFWGLGIVLVGVILFYVYSLPKISVIVPVYNTEKYLDECLTSLKKQTLKNIEFIIIDDGSNDKSYEIMQKYAKNDRRFKIFHQENKGVGLTRNFGMDKARGKYIGFVDSDDYVAPNYFEKLYKRAEEYNAEVAIMTHSVKFSENQKEIKYYLESYSNYKFIEDLSSLVANIGEQTNKIYRRDFIKKNNIFCWKERIWFEDVWFSSLVVLYAHRIAITDETMYYYRYNPQGITQSSRMTEEIFWKGLNLYGNLVKRVWREDFEENKKIELSKLIYDRVRWYIDNYWRFGQRFGEIDKYYNCFMSDNLKPSKFCLFEY